MKSGEGVTREFVILPEFDKQWKAIGFTDKELKALQEELTINPSKGDVMQGTGGLRKIRVAFEGRGKAEAQEYVMLILRCMSVFI